MARKRYQRGSVYLDGQQWKGRYREDVVTEHGTKRVRREVILGGKHELPTKRLAERRMEIALARINALDYRPCRIASFGDAAGRRLTSVVEDPLLYFGKARRYVFCCGDDALAIRHIDPGAIDAGAQ